MNVSHDAILQLCWGLTWAPLTLNHSFFFYCTFTICDFRGSSLLNTNIWISICSVLILSWLAHPLCVVSAACVSCVFVCVSMCDLDSEGYHRPTYVFPSYFLSNVSDPVEYASFLVALTFPQMLPFSGTSANVDNLAFKWWWNHL